MNAVSAGSRQLMQQVPEKCQVCPVVIGRPMMVPRSFDRIASLPPEQRQKQHRPASRHPPSPSRPYLTDSNAELVVLSKQSYFRQASAAALPSTSLYPSAASISLHHEARCICAERMDMVRSGYSQGNLEDGRIR